MNSHNCHQWLFASLVCFIVDLEAANSIEDGVIKAFNTNASLKLFCLRYFPEIFQLPSENDARPYPLRDLTLWSGCETGADALGPFTQLGPIKGEVVVVEKPFNCTLLQKAKVVEEMGGSGVIVVDSKQSISSLNRAQHIRLNISLAIISNDSFQQIKTLGPDVKVIQYASMKSSYIDFSLVVVWLIAMFSVILGAYWESIVRRLTTRLPLTQQDAFPDESGVHRVQRSTEQHKQETVHLSSPTAVIVLVVCMCAMLLLIYFFYSYLVYVLIAFYCLGCTSSLYQLFTPFLHLVPIGKLWMKKSLLFLTWASIAITWLVLRKQSYSWILQNFLGIGLLTNVLNVLRFPSFKIITILLVLLFLYDIFFVFITPLFTKNGESVMVEAASGGSGSGGEQMPMIFKVPNFNAYSNCETRYLFLGLGDVLFPGLLIGYCFRFEPESRFKVYFISSTIAYGCGLLLTFIGLFFMSSAQPALLYLVPTMLLTSTVIALIRKEFYSFWTGTIVGQNDYGDDDDGTVYTEVDVPNATADLNEHLSDADPTLNQIEDGKCLIR